MVLNNSGRWECLKQEIVSSSLVKRPAEAQILAPDGTKWLTRTVPAFFDEYLP